MNSRVLGLLMFIGGIVLLIHGIAMKFFLHAPVPKSNPDDLFFLKPPPVQTGVPDYVPILAGAILMALGLLLRLGK
jgi:hypothetical protein